MRSIKFKKHGVYMKVKLKFPSARIHCGLLTYRKSSGAYGCYILYFCWTNGQFFLWKPSLWFADKNNISNISWNLLKLLDVYDERAYGFNRKMNSVFWLDIAFLSQLAEKKNTAPSRGKMKERSQIIEPIAGN